MQLRTKHGFSLVEMSVVVAIIGLLVGAVITGRTLLETTRINKTVAETEIYKSAYVQFEAKYNGLPGDFTEAARFFPGEQSGDGDGIIDWWDEGMWAWRHMVKAKLIPDGNYSGSYVSADGVVPGRDVPVTAYSPSGGYSFAFEEGLAGNNNYGARGNTYHIGKQLPNYTTKAPIFSGTVAFSLDSKLDDGNPSSGFIRSWDTFWTPQCTLGAVPSVTYNLNAQGEACALVLEF